MSDVPSAGGDVLDLSVREFLAATAAKQATPGGGSVAALCGALAAALATMALNYTVGKKAYAAYEEDIQTALSRLAAGGDLLQGLIAEDIAAYAALSPLLKLPEAERRVHPDYAATVVAAIRSPETAGGIANRILEICLSMREKTNKFLLSDLAVAAAYAHATVHASEFNVRVNLPLLPEPEEAAGVKKRVYELSLKADKTYEELRNHLLRVI